MTELEKIELLMSKVEAVGFKYTGVAKREQYAFNAFSILRKSHEEVGLHSAFLKALFDPHGGHGQGTWFLNRFLKRAENTKTKEAIEPVGEKNDVEVFSEYTRLRHTEDGKKRDSIDIYIRDENRAIIIENKIHAKDQDRQLGRYVDLVEKIGATKIDVIYLTLDGSDPSEKSLGSYKNEDVIKMSYKYHVDAWLDECIEHMVKYPTTRESLILYQRVVRKLTGKSMNEEENMEIVNHLIDKPDNYRLARKISGAMDSAKHEVEKLFWEDLKKALGVKVKIKSDNFASVIDNGRPKIWYAIKIPLGILSKQANKKVYFYVAVEYRVYYGFGFCDDQESSTEDKKNPLQDAFEGSTFEPGTWKYAWHKGDRINLKAFDNGATIGLIDKDQRKDFVKALAEVVKKDLQEGIEILKNNGLLINEEAIWNHPET